jgi:hypothetical protein
MNVKIFQLERFMNDASKLLESSSQNDFLPSFTRFYEETKSKENLLFSKKRGGLLNFS